MSSRLSLRSLIVICVAAVSAMGAEGGCDCNNSDPVNPNVCSPVCAVGSTCQNGTCVAQCSPSSCPSGVCLTATQCAECSSDAQCGGATPRCLVAANRCVACLAGASDNCGPTAYCDTTTYTCQRGCNFANECNSGVCQANHECVNCISDNECTAGNICNNGSCEAPCATSAQCGADSLCCGNACTADDAETNCHGCGVSCTADQFCGQTSCTDLKVSAICERSKVKVVTNGYAVDNQGGNAVGAALVANCGRPINLTTSSELDPAVLNQLNGAPLTDKDTLLVYSGGSFVHLGTRGAVEIFGHTKIYDTTEDGVNLLIRDRTGTTLFSFNATNIGPNHDYFIVEVAQTPEKQVMFILFGMDAPGTRAAADWVIRNVIPNRATFNSAYYLVEWTDQNGDSQPNAADSFDILLQE